MHKLFFSYTCHPLPMPTPQGKECGQADVGTPEGVMEGLLKSLGGGWE